MMELCYSDGFVLPSNYVSVTEEEMTYLEGGVSLPVSKSYLNKSTCLSVASKYTSATGLGQERLAKEIYAHAVMYYASAAAFLAYAPILLSPLGLTSATTVLPTLWYIRDHSNPIDLGGDSDFRVSVYNTIWNVL